MTNWKKYKLGNVVDLKRGYDLPQQNRKAGKVPIYSSSGLSGFHNESKANGPGVITGRYGTLGELFYSECDFWPHNTTLYVKDFKGNLPKFIYYFLQTLGFNNQNNKTSVPGLNRNHLHELDVLFINDILIQTRIASILSSLDDKIELNRRMNQTLEQMAQALFNHYFVDNIDPDNLPEGWKMGKVADVGFVQNGYAFKSKDFEEKGEVGIIKIKNINNNIVDIHTTHFIDKNLTNTLDKKFTVQSGDMLIAMTGANVGKIGIVPHHHKELWLNQRVGNIKERNGYGKHFLYVLLTSDNYQNELNTTAMGSAQPNISGTDIENIKVIVPKKELIQNFDDLLSPMFEMICQNLEENFILGTIRDTLLPKLMSGKIDVSELKDEQLKEDYVIENILNA